MKCFRTALAAVALNALALSARGADANAPLVRLALDDVPPGTAAAVLERTGPLPFPVAVRIESATSDPDPSLDSRIAELARRRRPVWLAIPAPATVAGVDRWRAALRRIVDRHADALTVLEVLVDQQPPRVAAFALQNVATDIGADREHVRVALGGPAVADAARRAELYTADLAPYVDLLAVPRAALDELSAWAERAKLHPILAVTPSATPAALPLDDVLDDLGTERAIRAWRAGDVTPESLRALAALGALLEHTVTALDDPGVQFTLVRSGGAGGVTHRLLFDTDTFSTFLAYRGPRAADRISVALSVPIEGTASVIDLETGERAAVGDYARDARANRVSATLPLTGHTMLVTFNEGAEPIADRAGVSAVRALTVAEIMARHQQQQRAQDAVLQNYTANARMEQHFRPTVADPGYDVVTEDRFYSGPDGAEWEELSFCVNGACWGNDRPSFPLIQAEKVLALPLQLRFDDGYRYRLDGSDRVDGFDCYVIRFDPVRDDKALYKGTIWIDKRSFGRIRVRAVQSGLAAPVVSNDEDQRYTLAATIGNRPVFLFTKLIAKQIVLVAGRNLLVEKTIDFSDFRVNDEEFERRRASANESRNVMLKETANGLRYYNLENGRRVISDRATVDVRAMAMGVTLDPSYAFPLPILGINYIDFQFVRPDTQLAILFAGVLAAGNIQKSNFLAKNVDASVDFFAIGVPASDRIYENGSEDESARLLTWPLSTGLNIGWQATEFQKATFQYRFQFDGFVRDRTTAETFTTPTSTITNGIGAAWEYRRNGYSVTMNGGLYRRLSWRDWGAVPTATSPSFAKYSAGVSRDFYLGPFQKIHLNGAWFSGQDLDRLNKYQFGMFDETRLHGVPSSGVRFGEIAMFRGAYSFNLFDQYRLDLFAEHAWGRDEPGEGSWDRIPGFGFALNVKAPWNTILRADFGKSVLPDRYGNLGSTTLQIMVLKPLR